MTYTERNTTGAVHVQYITPQNEELVTCTFSSRFAGAYTAFPKSHVDLYGALALTGTKHRTKADIEEYLKRHGILFSVRHGIGTIHLELTVVLGKLPEALALIEEYLFEFKLNAHEFTIAQGRRLEEIREAHDDAEYIASTLFLNTLYPKHSLSAVEPLRDQKKNSARATQGDITAIHKAVVSGTWYISCVGANRAAKILTPFIEKLSKSAKEVAIPHEIHTAKAATSHFETVSGKTNVEIRIGNVIPFTMEHPDYVPFVFGLDVLGKPGGFSGRLMSTVREKEGLTYTSYARVDYLAAQYTGHWNIRTFFTAKDLEQGLRSTMREVTKIAEKGITPRELSVFKEMLRNQFIILHDSHRGLLKGYHGLFLRGQTEADIQQFVTETDALTKKAVDTALRTYLIPKDVVITGAGPVTKDGKGIVS